MTKDIRKQIAQAVYQQADKVDWLHLSISQRRNYYEMWTADPKIGGALAEAVGTDNVRVYLKDTIMKNYSKSKKLKLSDLLTMMSITYGAITQKYVKPEGVLCDGTHVYHITAAKNWKVALISAYERAYDCKEVIDNVLFVTNHTSGRYIDQDYRSMIQAAGVKLGVKIHWVY